MAYLQASSGVPVPLETIREMARLLGLSIPEEDLAALSTVLRDQLAAGDRLASLDLRGVAPIPSFDARWDE